VSESQLLGVQKKALQAEFFCVPPTFLAPVLGVPNDGADCFGGVNADLMRATGAQFCIDLHTAGKTAPDLKHRCGRLAVGGDPDDPLAAAQCVFSQRQGDSPTVSARSSVEKRLIEFINRASLLLLL
jgi:hypothetical protein